MFGFLEAVSVDGKSCFVRPVGDRVIIYEPTGEVVKYKDQCTRDQNNIDILLDDLYDLPGYANGKIYSHGRGFRVEQEARLLEDDCIPIEWIKEYVEEENDAQVREAVWDLLRTWDVTIKEDK